MPYFDYSAHTQADPSVLRRLVELEEHTIGNANSAHQEGRAANAVMASILEDIASLCKVSPEELILTSGATESNNLAVKGIAMASRHVGKHIISTAMEHSSVSACLTSLQASGYEIDLVRVGSDGLIDTEELRDLLRRDTCLVSISAVESEAGIVQPVEEIASILASFPNTRLHIDTTQAIGKIPVSFAYGDTISFSPHKFYGLTGTGVLIRKKGVSLSPQMEGGASTTPYRSGTPALSLSGSIVPALETALKEQETHYQEVLKKNLFLKEQLSSIPSIRINSSKHSIPHILNLGIKGINGRDLQKRLDEKGYCISVKSACSSDLLPSRTVMAMYKDRRRALEAVRISISHKTTEEELQGLAQALKDIAEEVVS